MIIPFAGPLDLASTLESGQSFRWRRADSWFQGVLGDNAVNIRSVPEGIEFTSEPGDETDLEPVVQDYLRLDDDLEAIYASIDVDDRIAAAFAGYRGMRILRQDPWECLVSFVCSANSNIPRISANVEDMSKSFGHRICGDDDEEERTKYTFPSPVAIVQAGETRLRQLGLGFRARYLPTIARTVAEGEVDLMALREAPYQEALESLTALPGVADKVANCVMLFSMDKLEAFPVDVWIHRVLQERYLGGADVKLSRTKMREWAQERFGPYAGYANQYLFHSRRLQGKASG